jgi:hypothetical protein
MEKARVSVTLTRPYVEALDRLVEEGVYLSREPVAYATGIWAWLQPYTPQVYFGSTVANALVWSGMCLIEIKLWENKRELRGLAKRGQLTLIQSRQHSPL